MAKILICTGIYPPLVGGPAQYALEVEKEFKRGGNNVLVRTYGLERSLPSLIRHGLFFERVFFCLRGVDFILALDTFSVGWPAVAAAKILRKKIIVRTGGDFLWESYVERTGDLVLFRDFYNTRRQKFNFKERMIFVITRWTLKNVNAVIFSTEWQKKIFEEAYDLDPQKNYIVENFYGEKLVSVEKKNKVFVAGTRPLKWKNIRRLQESFSLAREIEPTIDLDLVGAQYEIFLEKIRTCYCVVLVSLGDISPNMVLDALRSNTPFILTKETGLYEKLKDVGLFVDPENVGDIKEKILYLANENNYKLAKAKVEAFGFTYGWKEICNEILEVSKKIK